ncbi:sulfite exporter TauE/SafE family protein [Thermococcus sp. MV5]|uniref:sulfite exporter TauE/SafE family protein n=1 Tax=Thermococcus sp. MV5 TaxID=1638272 RepID=UPI0014394A9D|nr:sulfite exporter TauE/SafE family protein [Thermococcus sp. MV5]NJE26432.1 sulfite exporter TauE/SafE family protein [Thermococcus sp. MV5]
MFVYIFLGFLVGTLVGLTGMGGGALMTPALIFFGVEPVVAIGTDLLYAAVTRVFGVFFHHRNNGLRFDLALRLFLGSLPAIVLGNFLLREIKRTVLNEYLTLLLGSVLLITSTLTLIKGEIKVPIRPRREYLYLLGFVVGLTVQFTSVGAGVIVSFALMNLARVNPREVVGVTIVYGLALSFFSFLNYALLGRVDYSLAFFLVLGTVPGVYLGTRINMRVNKERLKKMINITILLIGVLVLLGR